MKPKAGHNAKPRRRLRRAGLGLVCALVLAIGPSASAARHLRRGKGKLPPDLAEILSRMTDAGKHLKTLSANLEYTKVTVLVNDKSTESGQLFLHGSKNREVLIKIQKPDAKVILFKKNRAEIYIPKINQIQEFDLEEHAGLVEEFFTLLGFGKQTEELKKDYKLKFVAEEDLEDDTTAVLELTPRKESTSAHIDKVMLWVSEESWLPVQQKIFEPGGDYMIARYTGVKVNRHIPASTFEISTAPGAKRVKMN
jgi:outer membrane lipoprotein-sorting protein